MESTTEATTQQNNEVFRINSENTQLKECINKTIKIWRRFHLDYNQISYITKEARKLLEVKRIKPSVVVVQRLSKEEIEKIINYAYELKGIYGLMVKTLFFTGCRVNEFVNIKIEHINFGENEIYVEKGKRNKQRFVPTFPFLKQEILTHVGSRKQGYLFETRLNNKFSTRRVQQIIKQISKEAGIERKVYPHLLRKSIATFLLNRGMPIDQVQLFLGHSKLETTQIYAKTSIQNLKENYQRLIEG